MIRIDAIWLATEPMDMRSGIEKALARVVTAFSASQPHCAYLFANRRGNRMKVLVHDGLGVWLAARRLHQGDFSWSSNRHGDQMELNPEADLVTQNRMPIRLRASHVVRTLQVAQVAGFLCNSSAHGYHACLIVRRYVHADVVETP